MEFISNRYILCVYQLNALGEYYGLDIKLGLDSKINKSPNDKGIWFSDEDYQKQVKSFGNPNYDPETDLSKGKSELAAHTISIGKASDSIQAFNASKEYMTELSGNPKTIGELQELIKDIDPNINLVGMWETTWWDVSIYESKDGAVVIDLDGDSYKDSIVSGVIPIDYTVLD